MHKQLTAAIAAFAMLGGTALATDHHLWMEDAEAQAEIRTWTQELAVEPWTPPASALRIGTVRITATDSNLARVRASFEVPEVAPGDYAIMLCDEGCTRPLADMIPSKVIITADAVTAVVEAAGERVPRLERPAGLTEREAEVLGMLARGLQTKQVARGLGISVKTADSHIQHAYRKVGVSTRAAATLFAMEHGLIASGELPIVRAAPRS
jgi:DNA-binding CsgD family transcriptional regulator